MFCFVLFCLFCFVLFPIRSPPYGSSGSHHRPTPPLAASPSYVATGRRHVSTPAPNSHRSRHRQPHAALGTRLGITCPAGFPRSCRPCPPCTQTRGHRSSSPPPHTTLPPHAAPGPKCKVGTRGGVCTDTVGPHGVLSTSRHSPVHHFGPTSPPASGRGPERPYCPAVASTARVTTAAGLMAHHPRYPPTSSLPSLLCDAEQHVDLLPAEPSSSSSRCVEPRGAPSPPPSRRRRLGQMRPPLPARAWRGCPPRHPLLLPPPPSAAPNRVEPPDVAAAASSACVWRVRRGCGCAWAGQGLGQAGLKEPH